MIRSLLYDMFTKSMVFHGAYTTNKNIKHIIIDSGNKLPKVGVSWESSVPDLNKVVIASLKEKTLPVLMQNTLERKVSSLVKVHD